MRHEFARGHRRYLLSLDVDLFNAIVINRHWYGQGSRGHGGLQELFGCDAQARARFEAITQYLLKAGYQRI